MGLPLRLAAGVVDGILVIALWLGLGYLGGRLGGPAKALQIVAVLMPLLYFVIPEAYYQTTPGKRLFGLSVVTIDGGQPDTLAHIVRGMTRLPEALVLVPYLIVVPFSKRHQRFGDMITETLVVKRQAAGAR